MISALVSIILIAIILIMINVLDRPSKEDFEKYDIHQALFNKGDYRVDIDYKFLFKNDIVYWNGYFKINESSVDYYCCKDRKYIWIPSKLLTKISD